MRGQLIVRGIGLNVMRGKKIRLDLWMMRGVRMRMVHGMMLVQFPVPVCIRAGLRPGQWRLRIIRLAIRSVSW